MRRYNIAFQNDFYAVINMLLSYVRAPSQLVAYDCGTKVWFYVAGTALCMNFSAYFLSYNIVILNNEVGQPFLLLQESFQKMEA